MFAVWASLKRLPEADVLSLQKSYNEGLANMEKIYERRKYLPVDLEFVKRYYNINLHYQLTKSDYEGSPQCS